MRFSPRVKTGVFVLEGVNALATSLYFYYLFFLMRAEHGFTNLGNLTLCATSGLVYTIVVWLAGKFAQRRGYFLALQIGFGCMALALLVGAQIQTVAGHVTILVMWTVGMCFTWPTLEAITSEHEPPARLQRLIGIYNVVWASGSGLAYFIGGALLEQWGRQSIFWVPASLHLFQLALLAWLARLARRAPPPRPKPEPQPARRASVAERRRSPVAPRVFLLMAWWANPFAYIAMNAMLPVIPKLAEELGLGPMLAGFFCSVWFFARALAFLALWLWTGWHYRFRWLASAYVALMVCFATILLGRNLWLLVSVQVVFGAALGLVYYSSLYYSMDLGETKGEHGGFHEAAIGVGIFTGPAVGAASLAFFPELPNMNTWAVTVLLLGGLGGLAWLRWRRQARSKGAV
ncbi:MAG: MFS transporter [Verrucomicrobia bacterium]|nr:MFS transporter [Verrucomicrobiota bacterium]